MLPIARRGAHHALHGDPPIDPLGIALRRRAVTGKVTRWNAFRQAGM
jgi:hypothetical protein